MGPAQRPSRSSEHVSAATTCLPGGSPHQTRHRRSMLRWAMALVAFLCGAATVLVVMSLFSQIPAAELRTERVPECPTSIGDLLELPSNQLAQVDVAVANLLCGAGLPGAEGWDVQSSIATLDAWAAHVKRETDRHMYKFRQSPQEYENSEGYFRVLLMICTLQEDFGVCYNRDPKMRAGPTPQNEEDLSFFADARDVFIHGLLGTGHEWTCSSMPVLYIAVGRRLGYPLKLVQAKGHLFARWDDGKERFNIEGTSRGMNTFPDQHYMEWPRPITEKDMKLHRYLASLSPAEEVATFLSQRGFCLLAHNRAPEAMAAFAAAYAMDSDFYGYVHLVNKMAEKEWDHKWGRLMGQ